MPIKKKKAKQYLSLEKKKVKIKAFKIFKNLLKFLDSRQYIKFTEKIRFAQFRHT